MDHPQGLAMVPILTRIAEAYPQSLYYPLRLSSEQLVRLTDSLPSPVSSSSSLR